MRRGQPGHGHHGHHGGQWEGGRIPKGRVRGLLLAALLDGPAHGYELMRRLERQAGGLWRPSPGSVYPLLQLLDDDGLVRGKDIEGRKVYELTDQGRAQADQGPLRDLAEGTAAASGHLDLRAEVHRLHAAARQVGTAGSPEQLTDAVEIVRTARQALYRLLAE
ncbi:MAG TPA: helix-turn-helix transcriptional regulator [Trebonia sp.]|jgi:DNA-binding PadR family transcriptional regulator